MPFKKGVLLTITAAMFALVPCCQKAASPYYEVPPEYHVTRYRYTYINDHVVLVDPSTLASLKS
jgi:hypothetical protein